MSGYRIDREDVYVVTMPDGEIFSRERREEDAARQADRARLLQLTRDSFRDQIRAVWREAKTASGLSDHDLGWALSDLIDELRG